MKRNYLYLLTLILSLHCFSQENEVETDSSTIRQPIKSRKNEIKVGTIKILAGPIIDIEYERILNRYSSFGTNIVINLDSDYYFYDFSLSPFYRAYFTETKEYGTKGFFVQAFLNYYAGENGINFDNNNDKFQALGLGFGIGRKWINKQGFVFQFVLGVGRTIYGSKSAPTTVFQGDISIGYRF